MTETISLETLIDDITSLGIEELGLPVVLPAKNGKSTSLYFKNISTEQEIIALQSAEEFKGHHWAQKIKCEILARAVHRIDDTVLEGEQYVDLGEEGVYDFRKVLRDRFLTWGPELLQAIWKIYMVHCQNIDDRLKESFPESLIMTDYEKKFLERTVEMLEELSKDMVEQSESDEE